ncbi:MAG: hypothetical protein Q7Q73_03100 [Verrucomicrobiota bacterium JB024]|nr:hypothetical protein [Verrucomicrobiota bacterium JB024]
MTLTPRHLQNQIDAELEAREKVLWQEMPVPQLFTPASTGAFLFGIPWTAFALFWMWGASGFGKSDMDGPASFFFLFGLPFVLIGFGMLLSPLWTYRKALRTVYVITDRRAITFEGGRGMTIRSYPPAKLQNIYRKQHKNGSGDVVIEVNAWRDSDGDRRSEQLGFLRVRNAKQAETLLKTLAEAATPVSQP